MVTFRVVQGIVILQIFLQVHSLANKHQADGGEGLLHRAKRVIGGEEVEEGEWPWLVSLKGKVPTATFFNIPIAHRMLYCGASLVDRRWIITAAHCFLENDLGQKALVPKYWHARLGDRDLRATLQEKIKGYIGKFIEYNPWRHWELHAKEIFVHPRYDRNDHWKNDIALIKLEEEIPIDDDDLKHISLVSLPNQGNFSFPADGQTCVMKGWGCTESGGKVSEVAMATSLPKASDQECARFYAVSTTTRLCAGRIFGGVGICPGDSGGPLVCQNERQEWVQSGIASFTSASRPGDVIAVFTRVASYVDWIRQIIADNS